MSEKVNLGQEKRHKRGGTRQQKSVQCGCLRRNIIKGAPGKSGVSGVVVVTATSVVTVVVVVVSVVGRGSKGIGRHCMEHTLTG